MNEYHDGDVHKQIIFNSPVGTGRSTNLLVYLDKVTSSLDKGLPVDSI